MFDKPNNNIFNHYEDSSKCIVTIDKNCETSCKIIRQITQNQK